MSIADIPVEYGRRAAAGRSEVRGELLRELVRSPTFIVGALIVLWSDHLRDLRQLRSRRTDPYAQNLLGINKAPSSAHLFGTDQLGRDMFSRVIIGLARHSDHRAARDAARHRARAPSSGWSWGTSAAWSTTCSADSSRRSWRCRSSSPAMIASCALGRSNLELIIVIGLAVHAADRPHRARRGAARARARLRLGGAAARRGVAVHHVRRDPPERVRADHGRVHGPPRLRDLRRRSRCRSSASGSSPRRRTGGSRSRPTTARSRAGYWWEVLFDALAIVSLVVAVNLISDAVEGVLER